MSRPKTAAELMAALRSQPAFLEQAARRQEEHASQVALLREASEPLLRELAALGFAVASPAELPRGPVYTSAIPILVRWLAAATRTDLKEAIVRALAVPFAREAAPALISEFRKTPQDANSLKWAIANALEVNANEAVLSEMVELARNKSHGRAREMLVAGLGRIDDPQSRTTLLDLLNDDEVAGHAVMGLGSLGDPTTRPHVEPFLRHQKSWIRQEAQKTLSVLDKASRRR